MKKYLAPILVLTINIAMYSQVTIGSSAKPATGALLELKEFERSIDGSTATKGLLLPRVAIADPTVLQIAPETQKEEHIGTIVYAISDEPDESTVAEDPCAAIPIVASNVSGIMVWTGTEWEPLLAKEEESGPSLPSWVHPAVKLTQPDHEGNSYTYRYFGNPDHQHITLNEFISSGGIASDYQNFGYWMTENLRSKKYASNYPGVELQALGASKGTQFQQLYAYPRDVSKGTSTDADLTRDTDFIKYPNMGLLYTSAAISGEVVGNNITSTPNMQGICPDGWFLPTSKDWDDILAYLSEDEQVDEYTTYSERPIGKEVSRTVATECDIFMFPKSAEAGRSKEARKGALAIVSVGWGHVHLGKVFSGAIFEYPETPNTGSFTGTGVLYRAGSLSTTLNSIYYGFESQNRPLGTQMISVRCRRNTNPE